MSKTTTFVIGALAFCLGLFVGILVMSSETETFKKEKIQADTARRKIEAEQKGMWAKQLELKTELNKAKYRNDELVREVASMENKISEISKTNTVSNTGTNTVEKVVLQNNSSLSFYDIRANMKVMTEAQWKMYARSIEGKKVYWEGWVDEVNEKYFGGYEVWVDMDPPEEELSVQDVTFDIPSYIALKLNKDDRIQFHGTISSILNVFGSCQVSLENASIQ